MNIKKFYFFCKWLDKITKTNEADHQVRKIRQKTLQRIDSTAQTVSLQNQIIHKAIHSFSQN